MIFERILTCAYCGHAYPAGTPPHGIELLTEHIQQCERHPMRAVIAERDMLRNALVGLVGSDNKPELESLELAVRRAATLNAINALLKTMPKDNVSPESAAP